MHRPHLPLLAVAVTVGLAGCSDQGPRSGPGTMTASLVSPNGPEGAAVVILMGEDLGAVTPLGETEAHSHAGDGATQVVLIHPSGGTLAFQVVVADTTAPPRGIVQQVAGPDDALRSDLSGYALEVVR